MRTVTGYIDGRPQWSENVPASSGSSKLGGSLVVAPSARTPERPYRNTLLDPKHDPKPAGRPKTLPDDEATERQRKSWREAAARRRARAKAA